MAQGKVDAVVVGADRVVANGDTANKIGTYSHAVSAEKHGVPFFIAAPTTTLDANLVTGADIEIEQRPADEITHFKGQRVVVEGIGVSEHGHLGVGALFVVDSLLRHRMPGGSSMLVLCQSMLRFE
jgi:methylthioribose-1-phosphate isomerase